MQSTQDRTAQNVTRRRGHATASSGDNALKIIEKGRSRRVTIGADWDPAPTQIVLVATSNWHHSFKPLRSVPIHTVRR
jgi:hypothetical protein